MDKRSNAILTAVAHVVLIFLSFLCLFFFYILIINSTRSHVELQKGFSFLPGSSFLTNLNNVINDPAILLRGDYHLFLRADGLRAVCLPVPAE